MGAIANMIDDEKIIVDAQASITIRRYIGGITGGVTLDVDGFPDNVIKSGHPVIFNVKEGIYKPFPISNGAFGTLPEGYEYKGVVVVSQPKARPIVAVMNIGEVNDKAMPYELTAEMRTALKAAIPTLIFTHD